ncbi:MAG: Calx-beta domain-containing protein, partial [Pyrinomonadaceae bacterium]
KNGTVLPPGIITINADPNDQDHTSVASDGTDFLVAWHDWRGTNEYGNGSAYVARVSGAGVVLDNPSIKISDHTLWEAPVEAVYDGDNYFVVWHVDSTANFRISDNYGRRVSSGGVVLDQQSIPAATSFAHQFNPSLGYGDNRYLVIWNATGGCVNGSSCIKAQMLEKVTPELPSSQNDLTAVSSSSNKVSPAQASSAWTAEASNTGYMLHNVWAFDESHVYVSTEADDGTVLKYDGADWSLLAMIPTARKFGLWGMGPLNLWSTGHCWNIAHYDGTTIESTNCHQDSQTGDYAMGEAIWGTSTANIYSVGVFGGIIQYNGTNWVKTPSGVPQDLWDVWGTSPSNVYAVGEFGTIIKYNGSLWTKQPNIPTIQSLNAIWGSGASDIFAVGDNGAIIHYNGASWSVQPSGTTENLYGVWGWSGTSVYAVGAYGTILHYDGTSWTQEASGTSVVLSDVGGAANTVRAVGDHGVILKKTEKACTGTINPSSNTFDGSGGTGSLSVTAASTCNWTAVSNDSWLTVTTGASGTGNGTVNYSVAANLETGSRTGTLTVAGQTFAVTQTPTPADLHFSESVYSVNEGAGSRQITVERTGNTSGTVTVNYATSDGTAQTPPDYLFNAGTLTFGPGETVKSFDVVTFNDSLDEPDETLNLTLSNPTGLATLGTPNAATLMIVDNDPPPNITINDVNLFEGNAGATSLVFNVDLLQMSGQIVTVNFNTADGTALSGSDYQSQSGTLTFNPGDLRKTVTVQVSGDTLNEANETFFINLSNPANAIISKGQGIGIINNDDAPPSVTISDVNVIEGDTGTTAAVFNVGLSTLSGQTVGVDFAASDGSANSNSDFIPNAGHLNFNPGETIKTITVLVNGDTQTEPDENFFVTLTNPINLAIAHSQAVGTIVNDDASLQFNATGYNASEGAGFIQINVTRNGSSAKDVYVNYNATDGSAQQRTDYTIAAGTLRFAAGENTKSFIILIVDDAYVEGPETVNLSLSNPSGAGAGTPASAMLTITDNDALPPTANPIDVAQDFVTMHYYDFLNRVPDAGGLGYWTDQITQCGSDAHCVHERRIGVSAAYFIELEFQETGYVVYRLYRAAFGARPAYDKFMPDRAQLVGGPGLPASTLEFANRFVLRQDFLNAYPANTTPEQFVNRLFDTAGLVPYTQERQQEINAMKGIVGRTRAQVLLDVIEIAEFKTREYNPAFVLMQYFGYLRRDPDEGGYLFWLNVLNNREPNNYRGMVCSFITSQEYQERFSPISTRSNRDCSQ